MSMDRIRKRYSIPVKRGSRVRYTGEGKDRPEYGNVTRARGHHLNVRLDGHKHPMIFHPTWELEILP